MGNMELCCIMGKYESLHSYLYACQLIDRRRYELVAGNSYNFSWQYNCVNTNDIKRTCWSKIWNSISCFCKSKFWYKRSKYTCDASCNSCLRLVWHSNMDRR